MVVCLLIFQLEICCSSEKSKPMVTTHTARSQCKGWGHVSVPRQVQETGIGIPPMLELDEGPALERQQEGEQPRGPQLKRRLLVSCAALGKLPNFPGSHCPHL